MVSLMLSEPDKGSNQVDNGRWPDPFLQCSPVLGFLWWAIRRGSSWPRVTLPWNGHLRHAPKRYPISPSSIGASALGAWTELSLGSTSPWVFG